MNERILYFAILFHMLPLIKISVAGRHQKSSGYTLSSIGVIAMTGQIDLALSRQSHVHSTPCRFSMEVQCKPACRQQPESFPLFPFNSWAGLLRNITHRRLHRSQIEAGNFLKRI
ncbi:hypothetical protein B0H16DRAFT_313388 [Mycena metata]|uniref:Secreted protein n=1 Tax=Mycena metata TaxID=1033252 RepID=A0AAD7JS09_9AGAR|nr:hypothetical protein B0H16DRAFT_313388 [Mycena metata]